MKSFAYWLSCMGLLLGNGASAGEALVLAHPFPKEASFAPGVLSLICEDAFRQLGLDVEVRMLPPLRGSIEADAGRIDGEVGRARAYADTHPNLVRVDEALLSFRVAAFTRIPGLKIANWDSLKGTPYRVEYRSGYVTFKAQLEQVLPLPELFQVHEDVRLAQGHVLQAGLAVDHGRNLLQRQLAKLHKRYRDIYNAGLVQDTPVYIYLHKRHAALAPRLAEALSKMKANGAIGRHVATMLEEERGAEE